MPMGPIHYPSPWLPAAIVFPTSPTFESQSASATFTTVGRQNSTPLRQLGEDYRQCGSWMQSQDTGWSWGRLLNSLTIQSRLHRRTRRIWYNRRCNPS